MAECNSIDFTECNSVECNSIETSNLDNQQFRLNIINETKHYFIAEIKERELMTKRLSKYIASFDYFDKYLIALSATSGSISVASFETFIGTPVGIVSESFSLAFSLSSGLHEDFMTIINKERNYRELKESIRMMKGQEDKK